MSGTSVLNFVAQRIKLVFQPSTHCMASDTNRAKQLERKKVRLRVLEKRYLEQGYSMGEAVRLAWEAIKKERGSPDMEMERSVSRMLRSDAARKGWNSRRSDAS